MILAWSDLYALSVIILYLFGCSLAWWLPLTVWWQDGKQALKWTMPVSWSIQILIGYIFYCWAMVLWFMPVYAGVVVAANIITVVVWRRRLLHFPQWPKLQAGHWILGAVAVAVLLYVRLYDPLQTLAPGNNDTANHLGFFYDLYHLGYLSNPYYAPGYHLLLSFLTLLLDQVAVYRWVGPITSIFLAGGIYLFVRDYLKQPLLRWMYVIGSSSYVLHQWLLQTMSLFSSALTFLYLIVFLTLLSDTVFTWQRRLGLYTLCGVALAVSVPYFFVQFIFVVFGLFVVALCARSLNMWRYYGLCVCVTAICIGLGIGHVFLQTKVLQRGGGFPEVPIITKDDNNVVSIKSNFDDTVIEDPTNPTPTDQPAQPDDTSVIEPVVSRSFSERFLARCDRLQGLSWYPAVRPFILTVMDIFSIKQLRPANNMLSIGAYAWIGVAFIMLILGMRQRSLPWIVVSTASILYGFAIQTGSLEFSFYRGRSGWYLLWLALLGGIMIIDHYYRLAWKWPLLMVGVLVVGVSIARPPVFYRPYYVSTFDASWSYISPITTPRPVIISRQTLLSLLYPQALILPYDVSALTLPDSEPNRFLIFEKQFYPIDPLLSQQGLSGDDAYSFFYKQQEIYKIAFDQTNAAMQQSSEFANYVLLWENEVIAIYQWTKP